ncbi:MBL fold metallo-hydrolase [Pengzhenrongella sp.]|jgi:glyoxylase-like metal-dependent hydrolase (beta-lactamase superfamily II)|uniref:MBL fold metallo-hydrolase n=1 Tax=Pengzhenrongella sp. TaxID=2888820 RepID=UPI002F951084
MDVLTAVAPVFGTNCYVVVADDDVSCVVVDVGAGVAERVRGVVAERGLRPVAILATHGHVDHTWGAAEVSEAFGVPLFVHADDAYRLADPFVTLGLGDPTGGPLAQALTAYGLPPDRYRAPALIETFDSTTAELDLGGLRFAGGTLGVVHAPGHTKGASLFLLDGAPGTGSVLPFAPEEASLAADATRTALTGDVLFAGTIGRTDLPGGDEAAMAATLRNLAAILAPGTILLPGHGPASRMDLELRRNRYLAG